MWLHDTDNFTKLLNTKSLQIIKWEWKICGDDHHDDHSDDHGQCRDDHVAPWPGHDEIDKYWHDWL